MATVYGVNRTKLNTPIGSNVIGTAEVNAKEGIMYDTYEASSLSANDVIQLGGKLPDGAMVTSVQLITDDLGTGVTADVGDGHTADRYIDGADVATAAAVAEFPAAAEIDNVGYKVGTNTDDNQLQVTILGAAATGTIKLLVKFSL